MLRAAAAQCGGGGEARGDQRGSTYRDRDRDRVDRFPIVVRSVALAVIAVCAVLWLLDWAAEVFIPVLLGLMFSYALTPIVDRLQAWHIPRVIGATVLLASIIGGSVATMYSMEDDANALIESLPDTAQKIRQALRPQVRTPDSAIANMQEAATQIEQAAAETTPKSPTGGVTRVQIETPKFDIKAHLWSGTLGLVALLGQAMVVCFVTFFLLVSGDTFRRKMARIAGPTFKTKRITVEALDEITEQIKRYLLVQLFLSVLVGVATWLAFMWIGLAHAGVWGVLSGVLNDSLLRRDRGDRRLCAGRLRAVRHARDGIDRRRGIARHSRHRRTCADAVADRPRERHEPGGGIRRCARLGMAVGYLGPAARDADHAGDQSGLRSCGRPETDRRTAGGMKR